MAADMAQDDQNSPSAVQDVAGPAGNGPTDLQGGGDTRGIKRPRPSAAADDDDDDDDKTGRERRKIEIKFIQDKSRRHITFSKRKAGIMKKAYELSVLTGTQVLLLVVSETGLVYTFTTPKLQPLVTKPEGKNLIQACLNAPEPNTDSSNGVDPGDGGVDPGADDPSAHQQVPPQGNMQARAAANAAAAPMPPGYGMTPADLQYQAYLQQQQAAGGGQYPMPPQARMPTGHPGHQGDFK